MATISNTSVIPLFDNLVLQAPASTRTTAARPAARTSVQHVLSDRQPRLFDEFSALQSPDAWTSNNMGFLPSTFVQASLPYRDPGKIDVFSKTSGKVSLLIKPGDKIVQEVVLNSMGVSRVEHVAKSYGYPYGSIPRLVLAWITTEAFTTRKKELQFGKNLSGFMATLGMHNVSGGAHGSIGRLKDQTNRLLAAHITLVRNNSSINDGNLVQKRLPITSKTCIWDTEPGKSHDKGSSPFGSKILLSDEFYDELIANPVPLDFRALKELRASPVALDIYAWLTWTMFKLRNETLVDWSTLFQQFGSVGSERKFRENFRIALKHVLHVYVAANVRDTPAGLVLKPSPTHVPIKRQFFPGIDGSKAA